MNYKEKTVEITSLLQSNSEILGIDPSAIIVEGEAMQTLIIPERIIVAIFPKEVVAFENFVSKFWKCSIECTIYSATFIRSFEIAQKVITIMQGQSSIGISQWKVQQFLNTAKTTKIQIIGLSLLECNENV